MITFRTASAADAATIADLHARSWQQNYRNIYSDKYLDEDVESERLEVWTDRMINPKPTQHVIIAFDGETPCGFACTYLDHDAEWGSLLDNLHVASGWKGQGIGRELMRHSAEWVNEQKPGSCFHLFVLADNKPAMQMYEHVGGQRMKTELHDVPYDRQVAVYLYVWQDCRMLIQ